MRKNKMFLLLFSKESYLALLYIIREIYPVSPVVDVKNDLRSVGQPAMKTIPAKEISAQRGARTHDPEIKSLTLYRLS